MSAYLGVAENIILAMVSVTCEEVLCFNECLLCTIIGDTAIACEVPVRYSSSMFFMEVPARITRTFPDQFPPPPHAQTVSIFHHHRHHQQQQPFVHLSPRSNDSPGQNRHLSWHHPQPHKPHPPNPTLRHRPQSPQNIFLDISRHRRFQQSISRGK